MVRPRRDEFEICMEILELLSLSSDPIPITELIRKVGIKHIKAKKILESLLELEWIIESQSYNPDQRFGRLFTIEKKGNEILEIYLQKIKDLFFELGNR